MDDIGASMGLMATLMVLIVEGLVLNYCCLAAGESSAPCFATACLPACVCLLFLLLIMGVFSS